MKEYKAITIAIDTGWFDTPVNMDTNAVNAAFNDLAARSWELEGIQGLHTDGNTRGLLCVFSRQRT